ncbi:putative short-chain dehydrogenase reductase protein [Phaeoacremonium minimum UCRPA7]|uniref:Putative short-chain dehydrogenase reductase protein n=1 Tax=Phaeoacremonium minimum (strain UCR-PA7) TaxID=1286976 RepID=R8BGW2_PHAM7|nr:putative short-chain dehydrogenase reductase protein [Phaeoacremonium minimum UCRPA7]EON98524.1 putative short-chain dehydrogenase reductase protein [Phaeoacremonium minimum UCRPA7]
MGGNLSSYVPARDIPSLAGKVILITGGNTGIGKQMALDLSIHNPAQIWIAARNQKTGHATVEEIKSKAPDVSVHFLKLDLSSFASIKDAASTFLASATRLDVLTLNAGLMGGQLGKTKEGYEVQFGTMHVGHALLFKLLTPILLKTAEGPPRADVRVISVSSEGHKYVPKVGIVFESLKTDGAGLKATDRYGQCKLANVVFAMEVAKRYPQLTTVSLYPGTVKTELFSNSSGSLMIRFIQFMVQFFGLSIEDGAKSQLWAATAEGVVNGQYYDPVGIPDKASALAKSDDLGKKLWEWTEKELEGQSI